jgi:hypothetical protein
VPADEVTVRRPNDSPQAQVSFHLPTFSSNLRPDTDNTAALLEQLDSPEATGYNFN